MRSWTQALSICIGLLIATPTTSLAADWTIVDLGALAGANDTGGAVVNASGQAAGYSGSPSVLSAVMFSNGAAFDLGTFGGNGGSAVHDMNDHGVIVGHASGPDNLERAFVYSGGVMTDLGTFGGDHSMAFGINNGGTIVGRARNTEGGTQAFIYENGVMTPITTGTALDINNNGLVVGNYSIGLQTTFTYSHGNLQMIPGGVAWAVNDNGLMVGQTYFESLNTIEATYYANGSWHSMGNLGGTDGIAFGVNNRDQAVGHSNLANEAGRAFLYSNGIMHQLDDLLAPDSGWDYLGIARDINDRGQIVGQGWKDGQWRAFMMTPTMDPSPSR